MSQEITPEMKAEISKEIGRRIAALSPKKIANAIVQLPQNDREWLADKRTMQGILLGWLALGLTTREIRQEIATLREAANQPRSSA